MLINNRNFHYSAQVLLEQSESTRLSKLHPSLGASWILAIYSKDNAILNVLNRAIKSQ